MEQCRSKVLSCWLIFTLCLNGVLAGDWLIHLPNSPVCAVTGSSVVLSCWYDYPQSSETGGEGQISVQGGGGEAQQYDVLSEMWCLEESRCITPRYVFHSDGISPDPSYQNRVQYLGMPGTKNCSLRITDLKQSDSGTYVFYFITSHPTQKMPQQRGVQLLVADSPSAVTVLSNPSSEVTDGVTLCLACCSPAASSKALYRWYKSTNTTPQYAEPVWNITEVTSMDSGGYFCQIQTGDEVRNSAVLTINVQYPPKDTAISLSPPGEFQPRLPVTLACSSDANPPVHTYTWYQGQACLPYADKSSYRARMSSATMTGSNLTLSRTNISVMEYGQHCCVARNKHGSQTYSVTLKATKETPSSDSTGHKALYSGVTISILLVIVAIVAFLLIRRQKTSSQQSYVLTQTTAKEP
ncbi:sialoadhesin [Betta splendens]|uniref:Sialoadhesin n=1 Tax=Betta splendens TaxID=158456 RepID=A0A6P7KSG1_BETSP|nr:sialoadhesin [Betta splendens]